MNKKELIAAMAEKAGISQVEAAKSLDAFLSTFKEALKGDGIQIAGFFSAKAYEREAREAINPLTKEKIKVPAKKVVKIKISKSLQESL
ncbi:MAG: HU family DNA-binding protein [Christensenellales bacterium]|jgi:DNA-binding protein HU-beta